MKEKTLLQLSNLLFFTKEHLKQLEKNSHALDFNLKYWLKNNTIITFKKGFYILRSRWEKESDKESYLEYLVNKLYEPSYLSLEYILNKHSLLTEAIYTITSITTKKTKTFTNSLGRFEFYSISPKLFLGYELKKFSSGTILMAAKSKALFDYLYLRFLKMTPINKNVLRELRINWENINTKEFKEMQCCAKLTKSLRINQLFSLIKKTYYA